MLEKSREKNVCVNEVYRIKRFECSSRKVLYWNLFFFTIRVHVHKTSVRGFKPCDMVCYPAGSHKRMDMVSNKTSVFSCWFHQILIKTYQTRDQFSDFLLPSFGDPLGNCSLSLQFLGDRNSTKCGLLLV